MNPLMLFRSLPYLIIALLGAALIWTTHLYLGKRDQYAALTASVQALGEAAKANAEKVQKQSEANLQTVKESHEKLIPAIRAGAVANYLAAHPDRVQHCPGSGAVPGVATSLKLDDAALAEPLPDATLIEEAASDAAKLDSWQEWCQLNHCPIKD